jgi:MoaA/NifB/PqqE/SkfB family radical SAM enzyme
MNIRCNHCTVSFDEEEIIVGENETEYCPFCNQSGALMDVADVAQESGTNAAQHLTEQSKQAEN